MVAAGFQVLVLMMSPITVPQSPGSEPNQQESRPLVGPAERPHPVALGAELPSHLSTARLPGTTRPLHSDSPFTVHSAHGYYVFLASADPNAERLRYNADIRKVVQLVKMSDDLLLETGTAALSQFRTTWDETKQEWAFPKIVDPATQASEFSKLLALVPEHDRGPLYVRFCNIVTRYFREQPADSTQSAAPLDPVVAAERAREYLATFDYKLAEVVPNPSDRLNGNRESILSSYLGTDFRQSVDGGAADVFLDIHLGHGVTIPAELRVDNSTYAPTTPREVENATRESRAQQLNELLTTIEQRRTQPRVESDPMDLRGFRLDLLDLTPRNEARGLVRPADLTRLFKNLGEPSPSWQSSAVIGVFSTSSFSFLVVAKNTLAGETETELVPIPSGNRQLPFSKPAARDGHEILSRQGDSIKPLEPTAALVRFRPEEEWQEIVNEVQANQVRPASIPLEKFIDLEALSRARSQAMSREVPDLFRSVRQRHEFPPEFLGDRVDEPGLLRPSSLNQRLRTSSQLDPIGLELNAANLEYQRHKYPGLQSHLLDTPLDQAQTPPLFIQQVPPSIADENSGRVRLNITAPSKLDLRLENIEVLPETFGLPPRQTEDPQSISDSSPRFLQIRASSSELVESERRMLDSIDLESRWSPELPTDPTRIGVRSLPARPGEPLQLPQRMRWMLDGIANGELSVSGDRAYLSRLSETQLEQHLEMLRKEPATYRGSDAAIRSMQGVTDPLQFIDVRSFSDPIAVLRSQQAEPNTVERQFAEIRSQFSPSPSVLEAVQVGLGLRRIAVDLERYATEYVELSDSEGSELHQERAEQYRTWATELRSAATEVVSSAVGQSLTESPWRAPGDSAEVTDLETQIEQLDRLAGKVKTTAEREALGDSRKLAAAQQTVQRLELARDNLKESLTSLRTQQQQSTEAPSAKESEERSALAAQLRSDPELRLLTGYYLLREAEVGIFTGRTTPLSSYLESAGGSRPALRAFSPTDATDVSAEAVVDTLQAALGVTSRRDRYAAALFGADKAVSGERSQVLDTLLERIRTEARSLDATGVRPSNVAALDYAQVLRQYPEAPRGSERAGSQHDVERYFSFLAVKWSEFYEQNAIAYLSDTDKLALTKSLWREFMQFEGLSEESESWKVDAIGQSFKKNPYASLLTHRCYPRSLQVNDGIQESATDQLQHYAPEYVAEAQARARAFPEFARTQVLLVLQEQLVKGERSAGIQALIDAKLLTP